MSEYILRDISHSNEPILKKRTGTVSISRVDA